MFELYATGSYSLAGLRESFRTEYGKVFSKWHLEKLIKKPFYIGTYEWEGRTFERAKTKEWWGWGESNSRPKV